MVLSSATPEWGGAPPVSIWGGAQIGHVSSKRARPGNVSATDAEAAKYPQHGGVGTYDGQWVRVVQGSDTLRHREFANEKTPKFVIFSRTKRRSVDFIPHFGAEIARERLRTASLNAPRFSIGTQTGERSEQQP